MLQCTACASTYKPNAEYSACQCAPGYTRANTTAACAACGTGSWCAGAEAELEVCAVAVGAG